MGFLDALTALVLKVSTFDMSRHLSELYGLMDEAVGALQISFWDKASKNMGMIVLYQY